MAISYAVEGLSHEPLGFGSVERNALASERLARGEITREIAVCGRALPCQPLRPTYPPRSGSRWSRKHGTVAVAGIIPAVPYDVRCELCGLRFDAGYKLDVAVRAGRTRAICPGCRRPRPKSTKADRDWWLARFSMDEIKEMAAALNAWR